eukprot:TRINITY_DN13110_c0_g1_i1.p1 TRINITY_DN13110_c0_g1~~TRINITY_DN13110_c0_g1_i1.p1  ORF type:complete len:333 (+),score=59.30 TRINITY_DN13110_c0_g1_i1:79-1077(+)
MDAGKQTKAEPQAGRRKKTAKERRAQALRAHGRTLSRLIGAFAEVAAHRGNFLTPLATCLQQTLMASQSVRVPLSLDAALSLEAPTTGGGEVSRQGGHHEVPPQGGQEALTVGPTDLAMKLAVRQSDPEQPSQWTCGVGETLQHEGPEGPEWPDEGVEGPDDLEQYDYEEDERKQLWLRDPSDVTYEEYASFYQSLAQHREEPFAVKHLVVNAQLQFSALLFVPCRASCLRQTGNVRVLYDGNRVDELEVMPEWLDFVYGIIDFEEIPVAISWEARFRGVRESLVTVCLEMFTEITERGRRDCAEFHKQFGKYLKGVTHWKVIEFLNQYDVT